jgi:GAF domain-containing protein
MPNIPEQGHDLTEENARLKTENKLLRQGLHKLQRSIRALFHLQMSINQISATSDPIAVIDNILTSALEVVNAQNGCMILLDKETNELVYIYVLGDAKQKLSGYRLPPNEGLASWVVNTQKPKLVLDLQKEPRFSPLVDQLRGIGVTSLICVPLVDQQRSLGAIEVANITPGQPFREEHLDLMLLVALLASMIIVKAEGNSSS